MFLLKLVLHAIRTFSSSIFTFHNVSIKTDARDETEQGAGNFTFHNVSIKTSQHGGQAPPWPSLHSTMFLLKLFFSPSRFRSIHLYIPQCFY